MKKHIYTEAEKTEITRLYPHCSTKEIARLFGISAASVYNLADRLGLKKSPEYLKKLRSEMSRQACRQWNGTPFSKGARAGQQRQENECRGICQSFGHHV